jgi:hypothetical protein
MLEKDQPDSNAQQQHHSLFFFAACAVAVCLAHTGDITVFGNVYVLSIGFIVTALVVAPLGFWNLDDNIMIQKISCALVYIMVMIWVGVFLASGIEPSRVPAVGTQFTNILGTTVFNFAVITSIPSWVNEKKEKVSILSTLGLTMPLALLLFTITGLFGGMAYKPWFNGPDADNTLLNKLKSSSSAIAQLTFYLFPVVVNLTSIPVFAIMQRSATTHCRFAYFFASAVWLPVADVSLFSFYVRALFLFPFFL